MQLALLASSRVGIKPICPRCKVSSHDMGKDTVTAIMVKEGAIHVGCKCFKSRPGLLTSPEVSSHLALIHKRGLN